MKVVYTFILVALISFSSLAQDKEEIARVYFKKTLESYQAKDLEKTTRYLEKTVAYYEGIETGEIAVFGAKFYFELKQYNKAKDYLAAFFKLTKDKNAKDYNNMLVLYADTIDALDSKDKPAVADKVLKATIPVVAVNEEKEASLTEVMQEEDALLTAVPAVASVTEVVEDKDEWLTEATEVTKVTEVIDGKEEVYTEVQENTKGDLDFLIIEDVPVFPGCTGTKRELKGCFNKMVQMNFANNFMADLPSTLGLSSGKQKVLIKFKVNKLGNVVNLSARAPHPLLEKEVIRTMKLLPKMEPGKQNGKPVGVIYSIPFTLIIQGDNKDQEKED